jgi:hypothetical protein
VITAAIEAIDAGGPVEPRHSGPPANGSSLGLLAAFIVRQARIADPLLPLRLFRSRDLSAANAVQVLLAPRLFGMFFLGALSMRRVLGYDPLQVGLAYLPMALVMAAMSFRFTARLTTRFGVRATVLCAMLAIAGALALFARTPVHATYSADLLPSMLLFGLGAGLGFPSLSMLAMYGAAPEDSGLVNTCSLAARSALPCSPRWPPSERAACSPALRRRPARSTAGTTSRTWSGSRWSALRRRSR